MVLLATDDVTANSTKAVAAAVASTDDVVGTDSPTCFEHKYHVRNCSSTQVVIQFIKMLVKYIILGDNNQ